MSSGFELWSCGRWSVAAGFNLRRWAVGAWAMSRSRQGAGGFVAFLLPFWLQVLRVPDRPRLPDRGSPR